MPQYGRKLEIQICKLKGKYFGNMVGNSMFFNRMNIEVLCFLSERLGIIL